MLQWLLNSGSAGSLGVCNSKIILDFQFQNVLVCYIAYLPNWSHYFCRCRKFMVETRKQAHQDLSNSTYPTHPIEQTSYLHFILKILSPGYASESIDNGYEIRSLMVLPDPKRNLLCPPMKENIKKTKNWYEQGRHDQ